MASLLKDSLDNVGYQGTFVICDTESTGFAPNDMYSKLLQVSAVKVDLYHDASHFETFDELVNPELPFLPPRKSHPDEKRRAKIPKKYVELTGITDEMVQGKGGWKDVLPKFRGFIGTEAVMVYHNAPHDVEFLHYFGSKIGLDFRSMPVVDTCALAKYLWPDEPKKGGYKLESLAKKLGIEDPNHHNGLNDVMVTMELLKKEIHELAVRKELRKVTWQQMSAMHDDTLSDVMIQDVHLWQTPDRAHQRLYVELSHQTGPQAVEYANVYYEFANGTWGQKVRPGDLKVRNFKPIQSEVTRIFGLHTWDWPTVSSAVNNAGR